MRRREEAGGNSAIERQLYAVCMHTLDVRTTEGWVLSAKVWRATAHATSGAGYLFRTSKR